MTIIFHGHIEKLELGGPCHTQATIRGAMQRASQPFVLNMSKDEAAIYQPGTAVQIQIHPVGDPIGPVK